MAYVQIGDFPTADHLLRFVSGFGEIGRPFPPVLGAVKDTLSKRYDTMSTPAGTAVRGMQRMYLLKWTEGFITFATTEDDAA